MNEELQRAEEDKELAKLLKIQCGLLESFSCPKDSLFPQVDLFPLPGFTVGSCGLLLPTATHTVLICGDTVATREHVKLRSVVSNAENIELAQESFTECLEIADVIIPGRDNVLLHFTR